MLFTNVLIKCADVRLLSKLVKLIEGNEFGVGEASSLPLPLNLYYDPLFSDFSVQKVEVRQRCLASVVWLV